MVAMGVFSVIEQVVTSLVVTTLEASHLNFHVKACNVDADGYSVQISLSVEWWRTIPGFDDFDFSHSEELVVPYVREERNLVANLTAAIASFAARCNALDEETYDAALRALEAA